MIRLIIVTFIVLLTLSSYANEAKLDAPQQLSQLIKQHEGQVIYVDFWASWCVPCRKSFPWMNTMQQRFKDKGFTVISINVDTDVMLANEFLVNNPANFPVIFDQQALLAKQYDLLGMPSSYLYASDGKLMATHVGFFNDKKPHYEAQINALLK